MAQSISVIIPTVGEQTLELTLRAIIPQLTDLDEVIVVGTFSSVLPKTFSNIKFVSTNKKVNAASARNIGMQVAKGEVFLFTDSDCIPNGDWIEGHRHYQKQDQKIIGGGVDLNHPNFLSLADNISMFHEFSSKQAATQKKYLPTCNLSVHRSVWTDLGGFDESFDKSGGEDSDWTLRMSQMGYELLFEPHLTVKHLTERLTLKAVFNHWLQSGKNNVRVRRKFIKEYNHPLWLYSPRLILLLSPLISLWATIKIFSQRKFINYLATLPIVYFSKIVYCWGAATQSPRK